ARRRVMAERAQRVLGPAALDAREREGVGERLAAIGERGLDDVFHTPILTRLLDAPECDERRVDVRPWSEDFARYRMEADAFGCELNEHRDRAVRLRSRPREEPVGDLPLHHHAPELDR